MTSANGWPLVPLRELLTPVSRQVPVQPDNDYELLGAHWYAKGLYMKEKKSGSRIKASTLYRVHEGDFVYNRLFAWKGSFAVVSPANHGCFVSNEFPCFDIQRERLIPGFLWYYFSREASWNDALGLSFGATPTSRNRLKEEHLLGLQIPLPPLQEQRRIVAKIDRLAGKIEEASGANRLARVESDALVGARARNAFASFSAQTPIEEIADVRGGIQKGPHRTPGANPVRYVTVAHVQRNCILTDRPRFFEVTPAELERWRLVTGDVLIIEGNGSAEQIGRTALFRGEIENCVHQNHVIRIRPEPERISPDFLNAFLNSPPGQEAVQQQSRTTSGLRTLSVGRIKAIRVPTPPITDQHKVVAFINRLASVADELKRVRQGAAVELDALLPSVLDRAFKGAL